MINCLICHKPAELLVDKVRDYFILKGQSPDFKISYCPFCKIAFSLPWLTDEELAESYPPEYEAYNKRKLFLGFLQSIKYKNDLRFIKKKLNKNAVSLFDIGAGRGEFLAQAKNFGFSISGLEPSQAGRQAAKNLFSIDLSGGYAGELELKEKYDVITMRHVFEHLSDPGKILEKIRSGLADHGILFLKLPRLDSWEAKFFKKYWHGYDLPRHRFHYSRAGIVNLLKNSGFSQVEIIGENIPGDILRSLEYYNLSESNLASGLIKIFLTLPDIIKLTLAQVVAIILSPFNSGRMIVTAKSNNG